jgi:hypothetical protein
MGRPSRTRMKVTVAVSRIGSARTSTGMRTGKSVEEAWETYRSSSVSEASVKPMKRLPQSPRKIEAGWKL